MLPTKLAFVDIETTGGRFSWDRVIEIGIVLTEDGETSQTYSTLINPQTSIPPEIEKMTGISNHDVEAAPTFREVAGDILTLLKDYTFVAHNVRFDYGFLKAEFARLGATFCPKHFCTVRLSRALYPQYRRHNLDSLLERFSIKIESRHRALSDAVAIQTFYRLAKKQTSPENFTTAMQLVLKKPYLPIKLKQSVLDTLPESPGVYLFYGSDGAILYIGKSVNLKERILSHFAGDIHSPLEMKIAQQIESLETIETAGELGALLLESQLIKNKLPIYNKMLRNKQELVAIKATTDQHGYLRASLQATTTIKPDNLESFLGFFKSRRQAKDYLTTLAKDYQLCEKLLDLEKTTASCFAYRLNRCKGACLKKELPLAYNIRFVEAFSKSKIKPWPYNGPIIIEENNEQTGKRELFLIDKWCYLGNSKEDVFGSQDSTSLPYNFDLDTYKILLRYIFLHKKQPRIKTLNYKDTTPTQYETL
ncbi:MAG TPA: exonuclease domain-containing protein [Patescibacteria group bacterium]|nr:exonuclease domain-containing protein [Patescibacteria group bacterium]